MGQDRGRAMDDHAGVEPTLPNLVFPDWLACLRLDGVGHTIASALNSKRVPLTFAMIGGA